MTMNNGTVEELERRCFAVFDGREETPPLSDLADGLLKRQKENWPGLSDGYAALKAVRIREIRGDGWGVQVQFNSRRIVSSAAKLDPVEALRYE